MGEWWKRPALIAGLILGGGVLLVFALMAATVGVFFAGGGASGSQAGASTPALTGNLAALAAQLGVPERALEGVVLVDRASVDRVGCRAPWWLLLSVSVEESAAGTHGGASIGPDWVVRPSIGGPVLSPGSGFAVIDFGGSYDYARGPFQFISSSWVAMGEDYDGDGVADPDNWLDAALGAANHLCLSSGGRGGDLAVEATARRGLWGYNASQPYQDSIWTRAMSYLAQGGDQPGARQAAEVAPAGAPVGDLVDLPAQWCEKDDGTGCQLDVSWEPNVDAAFGAVLARTGIHLVAYSANRTYDYQAWLYAKNCGNDSSCPGGLTARPGTSNHEGGQAVDIGLAGCGIRCPLSGPGDPAWDALTTIGPAFGVYQCGPSHQCANGLDLTARDTPHFSATGN